MKKQTTFTPDIPFLRKDPRAQVKACSTPDCTEEGLYKAPRSPYDVRDYIWFCLDHVRAYNKCWNYFRGMDEIGMEDAIRKSTTWERPSWKFGTSSKPNMGPNTSHWQANMDDPLGVFDGVFEGGFNDASRANPQPSLSADEKNAWMVFGLSPCADQERVKKRYKELAKAHHPDANGGSRQAEDRLKTINLAYAVLKKQLSGNLS